MFFPNLCVTSVVIDWVYFEFLTEKKKKSAETRGCSEFIRTLRFWTRDLQIFSLTLSQLSYLGCWDCKGNFCINISIINNIVLTASAPHFASLWYNEQKNKNGASDITTVLAEKLQKQEWGTPCSENTIRSGKKGSLG